MTSVPNNPRRTDFVGRGYDFLNLGLVIGAHGLLLGWFLAAKSLPGIWFWPLSALFCLVHQKYLSEWVHEAAHYNFLSDRRLNDFCIDLLAGAWFLNSIALHRDDHFKHHAMREFFLPDDPDTHTFVVHTKKEFYGALFRDFFGITACRLFFSRTGAGSRKAKSARFWLITVCMHAVVFSFLLWQQLWMIYFLYYLVLGTLYPLFNRVRVYGQHVELRNDGAAVLLHSQTSRTIDAGILDRILFTSKLMLFHHEHHQSPTLPFRALARVCPRISDDNSFSTQRWGIMRKFFHGLR